MKPRLLQSFMLVAAFWFLAALIAWGLSDPVTVHASGLQLKRWLPFLPVELPDQPTIVNSLGTQIEVLKLWTLPVLALATLSFGIGYGVTWLKTKNMAVERKSREDGVGEYRGISVTLGALPIPSSPKRELVALEASTSELLAKLSPEQKNVLEQILGTISAAESRGHVFAGVGVTTSLTDYTLVLVFKLLKAGKNPGISAVAAAAHEMGKLTSYKKSDVSDQWVKTKNHDKEAGKLLSALPGWWALPHKERLAVMLAVRFKSQPSGMPIDIEGDAQAGRLGRDILSAVAEVQAKATEAEQKKTLSKAEVSELLYKSFIRSLALMPFQGYNQAKGVKNVAAKKGNRVFLFESALRDYLPEYIGEEIRGALSPIDGVTYKVQPMIKQLLALFHEKGMLVIKHGGSLLDPGSALWNMQSGTVTYRGVIVLDFPESLLGAVPDKDSPHSISIAGPYFEAQSIQTMTRGELGFMDKPADLPAPAPAFEAKPQATPKSGGQAPSTEPV